ncbi:unnamed protein product [Mytilus coruscus]|uniref:SWIM-type domain-containing protein n=1 Tax=Mytilus coruscus TaxID=42192 RepID=A0A6J8CBU4_MYTCO|nr:unnamed protein product [Mytilus coruscus]
MNTFSSNRVKDCIGTKRDVINVGVDDGKWYDLNLQEGVKDSESFQSTSNPQVPPIVGWKNFPSTDLQNHFIEGHIHHYIIESVQFVGKKQTSKEEDKCDIEDLHTSKPLQKGRQYFKSGHVQNIKDSKTENFYFLKSTVMASYRIDTFYNVTITVSSATGFVKDASCNCVGSSMGRCSHVAAVLFALLDDTQQFGTDQASCTSRRCEWNVGRKKKKDPKKMTESTYIGEKKNKVDKIIEFDPRPPTLKTDDNSSEEENVFFYNLQYHSCGNTMWSTGLNYNYEDYEMNMDTKLYLEKKRTELLHNLSAYGSDVPYEIVENQRSDEWFHQRAMRITVSNAKSVSTLKKESSVFNKLKKIMYETDPIKTKAMTYGIEHENDALKDYVSMKQKQSPLLEVAQCGLWVNPKYPELACSPDGLVRDVSDNGEEDFGLVEINFSFMLEKCSVKDFEKSLSKSQVANFCLERLSSDQIRLKRNHEYYFQIQMQLGTMGLQWCDLFVCSESDSFIEKIFFDKVFWDSLAKKLVKFHHTRLCPEYFEMRLPRGLPPFDLPE